MADTQREKFLSILVAELPGENFSSGKFFGKQPKMAAESCQFHKKCVKNEIVSGKLSPNNLEKENYLANFEYNLRTQKII